MVFSLCRTIEPDIQVTGLTMSMNKTPVLSNFREFSPKDCKSIQSLSQKVNHQHAHKHKGTQQEASGFLNKSTPQQNILQLREKTKILVF